MNYPILKYYLAKVSLSSKALGLCLLLSSTMSGANEHRSYSMSAILSVSNPELVHRFTLDPITDQQDISITVELKKAVQDKPTEHHFLLTVDCSGCGGIIKKTRFTTFPLGSAGKFVFILKRGQLKMLKHDQEITLNIHLSMQTTESATILIIPATIRVTQSLQTE